MYSQVKVKLAVCLIKHHIVKAYGEVEMLFPYILTLSIRWRVVGHLNALAASPGTQCLGGWGPQTWSGCSGED